MLSFTHVGGHTCTTQRHSAPAANKRCHGRTSPFMDATSMGVCSCLFVAFTSAPARTSTSASSRRPYPGTSPRTWSSAVYTAVTGDLRVHMTTKHKAYSTRGCHSPGLDSQGGHHLYIDAKHWAEWWPLSSICSAMRQRRFRAALQKEECCRHQADSSRSDSWSVRQSVSQ